MPISELPAITIRPMVQRVAAKRVSTPVLGLTLAFTDLALAAYFLVRAIRLFGPDTTGFGGVFEVGVAELFGLFSIGAALAWGLAFIVRRKQPLLSEHAGVVSVICGLVPPGLVVAFIGLEHFG
jgi:hypothetical protein